MAKNTTHISKNVLGQIPGSVIYTGKKDKQKLFIESFDYNKEQCTEKTLNTVQESFEYKLTDSITWINLNGLNHVGEIEKLGEHYDLHPLVLEDNVNLFHCPKIDAYGNYIFVIITMLFYANKENTV